MPITKFVCLAKSGKNHGLCIAGKTTKTKEWIRPVTEDGTLTYLQCKCNNQKEIELLDIVSCDCKERIPNKHQIENYTIGKMEDSYFSFQEKLCYSDLETLCDTPKTIFGIGSSSGKGKNDYFVPEKVTNSLLFVQVTNAKLFCHLEEFEGMRKKRHRMEFDYNQNQYDIAVTENSAYRRMDEGDEENYDKCYITVSIGVDYYSKFVSGIFVSDE